MLCKVNFIIFFMMLLNIKVVAQILDDSTELVYGPTTTKYIFEQDILNDDIQYFNVDTTISSFEKQSFVEKNDHKYQDLGGLGTALFPVFYVPQKMIGRISGYNAYRQFGYQQNNIKYYDTKSPYLKTFAYLGGENRNIIDFIFSRNINNHWNVTLGLNKITTDKQLSSNGVGDRQVEATSFIGYMHYKNETYPYQAIFNYSLQTHKTVELGGVRYTPDSIVSDLFQYQNSLLRLNDARNRFQSTHLHIYQDYRVKDALQFYHILDYTKEGTIYEDYSNDSGTQDGYDTYTDFYHHFFINEDTTYEQSELKSLQNEVGFKGNFSHVFYRLFMKLRSIDFGYVRSNPFEQKFEQYLGGYVRFNWKDKFDVTGKASLLPDGTYQLNTDFSSNNINFNYRSIRYHVPLLLQSYSGNHHNWQNDFSPIFANYLTGSLVTKFKFITLIPTVSILTYNNFVYLDTDITPIQSKSGAILSSVGGKVNFSFLNQKNEGWHVDNELIATTVSGGGAEMFRIPTFFYNGRYYWNGKFFNDNVPVQFGMSTHARTAYFANAYDPVIQGFYLQNDIQNDAYIKADAFVSMRLDKFFASLKWVYINQRNDDGYFTTPYYPGQRRTLDLIFKWLFFD